MYADPVLCYQTSPMVTPRPAILLGDNVKEFALTSCGAIV
jgi:hypothetical protein